jgi:hypothetical protein
LLTRQVPPNVSGHTTLAHWTSPLTNKRTQSATIGKTNRARYLGTPPKTQCWHRCQIEAIKMTVQKKILVTNRVRHPADGGFSWVDRRFLREFSERLSGDAVFMYLFLAAVSDKHGLSFYSDHDRNTYRNRGHPNRNRGHPEIAQKSLYRNRGHPEIAQKSLCQQPQIVRNGGTTG